MNRFRFDPTSAMDEISFLFNRAINRQESGICVECDGDGWVHVSCCGDDIKDNDTDLCPSCHEHCGEPETCEECDGSGHPVKS